MSGRHVTAIIALLFSLVLWQSSAAKELPKIRKIETPVKVYQYNNALSASSSSTALADTCIANPGGEAYFFYRGWLIGNEFYAAYDDPAVACPSPYPFTITEITAYLVYDSAAVDTLSMLVFDTSAANASCPTPGNLLTESSAFEITISEAGLWEITLPLDSPLVVEEPFFAGIFFVDILDSATFVNVGPHPVTDSSEPGDLLCHSYNLWDVDTGWVDIGTRGFGGRLSIFATGVPGGQSGGDPAPFPQIISHPTGGFNFGATNIWVEDISGSQILDYAVFYYASPPGGSYVRIGTDVDGTSPLRDGVTSTSAGDGFSFDWDPSNVAEGQIDLKVEIFDTLGRSAFVVAENIFLEPTPPLPVILSPSNGEIFCSNAFLIMDVVDENFLQVDIFLHAAATNYSSGLATFDQFSVGDSNGIPNDGNSKENGEFGDYYSAPVASAVALELWNQRGYTALMTDSAAAFGIDTLAEKLAEIFNTRSELGTFDERVFSGLKEYQNNHGNLMNIEYKRNPDYFDIRIKAEDDEAVVLLGLSGSPGLWMTVDGFNGWKQPNGDYYISTFIPTFGTIEDLLIRDFGTFSSLYYNGEWKKIDIMISVSATSWSVNRTLIGTDSVAGDGWLLNWTPTGVTEDQRYFIRAVGKDSTNLSLSNSILLNYNCSLTFVAGDYDGDNDADIIDLLFLRDFILNNGIPPEGGAFRSDANGDNSINLADIVYYALFLLGTVSDPAY